LVGTKRYRPGVDALDVRPRSTHVKRFAKILGVLLLVGVLCVVGFIALIELMSQRSERVVVATVAQLSPGTPFSAAVQRLGQPAQTFTNGEEIVYWAEHVGSRVEARIATNSVLHAFVHRGTPFRWILVYTDRKSQRVLYADWCHM
jgi:hypothetical protein